MKEYCIVMSRLSFNPQQNGLLELYKKLSSDDERMPHIEATLCQGITYFACLLENPGVWDAEAHA
jgi:hypothetical protein